MRISYLFAILFGILVSSCTNAPEKGQTAKEFFDAYYQKNERAFIKVVTKQNPQIDTSLVRQYFKCTMDYYFSVDSNFVHLSEKEFVEFTKEHEAEMQQHCGELNVTQGTV